VWILVSLPSASCFAACCALFSAADLFASSAFFSAALLAAASADAAACALALACFFFIAASLCLLQSKLLYTTHQLCQVNNQDCITPWYCQEA
jgi:hypothetical protein